MSLVCGLWRASVLPDFTSRRRLKEQVDLSFQEFTPLPFGREGLRILQFLLRFLHLGRKGRPKRFSPLELLHSADILDTYLRERESRKSKSNKPEKKCAATLQKYVHVNNLANKLEPAITPRDSNSPREVRRCCIQEDSCLLYTRLTKQTPPYAAQQIQPPTQPSSTSNAQQHSPPPS